MDVVTKLVNNHRLSKEEFVMLLNSETTNWERIREEAVRLRTEHYGNKVFTRGLIEFTNYCKNNCYYCGIRRDNREVSRYRLSKEEILLCCKKGYEIGYRTFVLQGGEDGYFTDERLLAIVTAIKENYPDCALTLSIGEREKESYERLKEAGVDRYLLRHETATRCHYEQLHPSEMKLVHRMNCLKELKALGYQVGAGFMVGSPYQTIEHIAEDLVFLQEFQPDMVGIGPFITHHETPFHSFENGSVELTLRLYSIVRILLPYVLLPATTAVGTLANDGRERGILAGCNVVMPNLSTPTVRKQYSLYDGKLTTGAEAAEGYETLKKAMKAIGYELVMERGDVNRVCE